MKIGLPSSALIAPSRHAGATTHMQVAGEQHISRRTGQNTTQETDLNKEVSFRETRAPSGANSDHLKALAPQKPTHAVPSDARTRRPRCELCDMTQAKRKLNRQRERWSHPGVAKASEEATENIAEEDIKSICKLSAEFFSQDGRAQLLVVGHATYCHNMEDIEAEYKKLLKDRDRTRRFEATLHKLMGVQHPKAGKQYIEKFTKCCAARATVALEPSSVTHVGSPCRPTAS